MQTDQPDNTENRPEEAAATPDQSAEVTQNLAESAQPAPAAEASTEAQPSAQSEEAVNPETPAEVAAVADASTEQPDGQVQESPEDIATEPGPVDPHIDLGLMEAYLFSTHSPLTAGKLAELFNLESTKPIRKAIRILNEQYEQTRRCFRVEQVAGGFQLLSLPEFGEKLKALHQKEQDSKLSKAALETLAIVAYKQPILRAEVESIRGVASGETIRSLMEKHLVKIAGRAEEPGRPILYGTTKRFLEVFGLNSLKDLPQPDQLQARAQQMAAAARRLAEQEEQEKASAAAEALANTPAANTPAVESTTPDQPASAATEEPEQDVLGPETSDETLPLPEGEATPEPLPAEPEPLAAEDETLPPEPANTTTDATNPETPS